jgi:DNA-binding XRE family transcriptional regulator
MPRGRKPGVPQPATSVEELRALGIDEPYVCLAVNVGRRRFEMGMTRNQLAEAADLNNQVLSSIELGRRDPSLSTLLKLCDALGIESLDELIAEVD